jgi:Nif-specific regulatory protein
MVGHGWPGNVRELENCVERVVIMTRETVIDAEELKKHLKLLLRSDPVGASHVAPPHDHSLPGNVRTIEREQISEALRQCGGVQAKAAKLLGLTPRQIGYKIRKYNIE